MRRGSRSARCSRRSAGSALGQFGLLGRARSGTTGTWCRRVGVSRQQTLLLMAPLNKRDPHERRRPCTTRSAQSFVQPAMTSAALRRIVRPARPARCARCRSTPRDRADQLIDARQRRRGQRRAAEGRRRRASSRPTRCADAVAADRTRRRACSTGCAAIRSCRCIVLIVGDRCSRCCCCLLLPSAVGCSSRRGHRGAACSLYRLLVDWRRRAVAASTASRERARRRSRSIGCPASPDFAITEPGAGVRAAAGGADSVEAARFKQALRDTLRAGPGQRDAAGAVPPQAPLDLGGDRGDGDRRDPSRRARSRSAIMAGIFIPPRIRDDLTPRRRDVRRADGLPGDRSADVRAAEEPVRPSCSCPTST